MDKQRLPLSRTSSLSIFGALSLPRELPSLSRASLLFLLLVISLLASSRSSAQILPVPTGLTATSLPGKIRLDWVDIAPGPPDYKMQKKVGDGAWVFLASFLFDTIGTIDSDVLPGTVYSYRLYTYSGNLVSAFSAEVSAMPMARLQAPTGLTATPIPGGIRLNWVDKSLGETNYLVQRKNLSNQFVDYATLPADTVSFTDTGLTIGRTYSYQVQSVAGNMPTVIAGPVSAQPLPASLPQRILSLTGNLDFGKVAVGDSAQLSLTVANTGDAPLTISNVVLPAGYTPVWTTGIIQPGTSQPLTITFRPTITGDFSSSNGSITSDATAGSGGISVSGMGVTPPALTLRKQGTQDILTWSAEFPGFKLEYTAQFPAGVWIGIIELPTLLGTNYVFTNATTAGNLYFRLKK